MYSIFDSSRSPLALWLYTLKIVLCLAELLLAHGVIGAGGVGQSPFPLPFKVELSLFSCGWATGVEGLLGLLLSVSFVCLFVCFFFLFCFLFFLSCYLLMWLAMFLLLPLLKFRCFRHVGSCSSCGCRVD